MIPSAIASKGDEYLFVKELANRRFIRKVADPVIFVSMPREWYQLIKEKGPRLKFFNQIARHAPAP